MCGGEPRAMLRKDRGKADKPIYTIQICIPNHGTLISLNVVLTKPFTIFLLTSLFCVALNLIFSFTNGVDWDGPYRLQFQVPKAFQNKPIEFFNAVNEHNFFSLIQLPLAQYTKHCSLIIKLTFLLMKK